MQKSYRAIIVDDERLARQDLRELLGEFPMLQVVGEADSVATAAKRIDELDPDLIFLDIQMPGESGFDLLQKHKIQAAIIFVTAYDEYAIRAFEVNALDYLLKPVHPERLHRAIAKLDTGEASEELPLKPLDLDDHLFLMFNDQFIFLHVRTVQSITAAGVYSEVRTADGRSGLTQKSMKEWESRLPANFCRIHRSSIVNLDSVDHVEEWFNYSYRVFLKGSTEPLAMSRRYAHKLKNKLS